MIVKLLRHILFVICITVPFIVSANSNDSISEIPVSTIMGNAPEYANTEVTLYKYHDYFTKKEVNIGRFTIDSLGEFSWTFPQPHTQEVFMYLGVYKCFLFAEPHAVHDIILPPRQDKTLVEELNPFFVPEDLSLGIKNPEADDLNMLIFKFNHMYETFLQNNFQFIYILRDKRIVDVLEQNVDSVFSHVEHDFFRTYVEYRIFALRHMAYQRDRLRATRNYLLHAEPAYYNPPYMFFFQTLWGNYIVHNHMRKKATDMRHSIVFGKSPTMFKEKLEEYMALRNDTLKELILLQCLDDCFKRPDMFPPQTVMQTLDSVIYLTKIPEHRKIAEAIKAHQFRLQQSDAAPDFILYDQDSVPVRLSQFLGKHVYLGFCRSENIECIMHYRILQNFNRRARRHIHIVIVSYERDFQTFSRFVKQNQRNYNWTFVYGADTPEIAEMYGVRGMPRYVLLDPDGNIEIFDAPTPEDSFQEKFADVYVKWRRFDAERRRQQQIQRQW